MNDPSIRLATESDARAAFDLMSELGYPDISFARFVETYNSVLEHPAMSLMLAEDEQGTIIGLVSISNRPQLRLAGALVTVDELVVADRARGRGMGRQLLNAALGMFRESGARRIELLTNRSRESYRREFYVKNGFVEADSAVMRIENDPPNAR